MTARGVRFVLVMLFALWTACNGQGCQGCATSELPETGIPVSQTIEGGGQLRITPSGFEKLMQYLEGLIKDGLAPGICIPKDSYGIGLGDIDYCTNTDGTCAPGCHADIVLDSLKTTQNGTRLSLTAQFDIKAKVPVAFDPLVGPTIGPCTMNLTASNTTVMAEIDLVTDMKTGEFGLKLVEVHDASISPSFSGCSFISTVTNALSGVIGSTLEDAIVDMLGPTFQGYLDEALPKPMGIVNTLHPTALFGTTKPQVAVNLEARVLPGSYASFVKGGLNIGLITAFNSDADQTTRDDANQSESAPCVPNVGARNIVGLDQTTRQSWRLPPIPATTGGNDGQSDIVMGLSERALDLFAHHLVSSGAMCLELSKQQVSQLAMGTFSPFIRSLARLGRGDEPILLVFRPNEVPDVALPLDDNNTKINLSVHSLSIDFYGYVFERYIRLFTATVNLDLSLGITFAPTESGNVGAMLTLSGLSADAIALEVSNQEFLPEDKASLEGLLPALLSLAFSQLAGALPVVEVPDVVGFHVTELSAQNVEENQEAMLVLRGKLEPAEAMPPAALLLSAPVATLRQVAMPTTSEIKQTLQGVGRAWPRATFAVPEVDGTGQPLEWSYRLHGGLARDFAPATGGKLLVEDLAFGVQDAYFIELFSRVKGQPTTLKSAGGFTLNIDSEAPTLSFAKGTDGWVAGGFDWVSGEDLQWKFGDGEFGSSRFVTSAAVQQMAHDQTLQVSVRDQAGNVTTEAFPVDTDVAQESSGCQLGGTASALGLLLVGFFLFAKKSKRFWIMPGVMTLALANTGCDEIAANQACAMECLCEGTQVGICEAGQCSCVEPPILGEVGAYSDIAVDPITQQVWASAYNTSYGDLMATQISEMGLVRDDAWTFVAGVPGAENGNPDMVRGGIEQTGDDVGKYSDIEVIGGFPSIAYYDATHRALGFSRHDGEVWTSHSVDTALGQDDTAGMYASQCEIAGAPAIAYFAQTFTGEAIRTELRLARSSLAVPQSSADWSIVTLDSLDFALPSEADVASETLQGVGLFASCAVSPDGKISVAYYDSASGDLKLVASADGGQSFMPATVLDGGEGDVGRYATARYLGEELFISYASGDRRQLKLWSEAQGSVVVDDGYRDANTIPAGGDVPEFHFVGDGVGLGFLGDKPSLVYQDATTLELLWATQGEEETWNRSVVVGRSPFVGGFGFFPKAATVEDGLIASCFAMNLTENAAWLQTFRLQ